MCEYFNMLCASIRVSVDSLCRDGDMLMVCVDMKMLGFYDTLLILNLFQDLLPENSWTKGLLWTNGLLFVSATVHCTVLLYKCWCKWYELHVGRHCEVHSYSIFNSGGEGGRAQPSNFKTGGAQVPISPSLTRSTSCCDHRVWEKPARTTSPYSILMYQE